MSSIALFPCTFLPVESATKEIATSLNLQVYNDSDLLREVSEKHGIQIERLQKALHGKTSVFNQFTLEREKMVNILKSEIAQKLTEPGSYLFIGFMTHLIPGSVSHVLRVLFVGSRPERIQYGISNGLTQREAKKAVHEDDVKAYSLTDFLFKKEAYESDLYDVVIPVEENNCQQLPEIVASYFRKTSVLRTGKSIQAVADMKLATEVERVLLENGHRLEVFSNHGSVLLKVQKSVLLFDKFAAELKALVKPVQGVQDLVIERGYDYNDSIYRQQKFELPSKVLFVDDEKDFVQTVSERLINRDVGTYGVFNGEEALNVIKDDRPDVMVLDLKMPGMYGVDVLREAKEIAPEVEVIILTGHGSNQDMRDCMKLGAFAYLNKPVDIEELSKTIKAAHTKAVEKKLEIA